MEKFLQMVINTFLKRVVNLVVDRGINHFAAKESPKDQASGATRDMAEANMNSAKQVGDIVKMMRRIK